MQLTQFYLATAALFSTALAIPAGKPTGGPASAQVTIYSGPYTCASADSPPPKDGSAGTAKVVNIAETQCVIVNIPFGGAFTATLTAPPKTGAPGCYIQIFSQQGCGVTLQNQYHGFPFDGTTLGSTVGCASPPVQSYGALQITCG
ncbi:hypothetical protein OPT61_g873 [Boeremia exigua]|uniref:Uncharacterized protein n=1 Tax=Boeremia exigua TaxID=749465 RepID=A0ACC2IS84_9PLEO|nr:hypothetical protein OPT61_g873 [Boeremia exigua]